MNLLYVSVIDRLLVIFKCLVDVGWAICKYYIRYLDGEATQGRYFRWTAFAIGSVSLMVVSGNLLMFMRACYTCQRQAVAASNCRYYCCGILASLPNCTSTDRS